MKPSLVSKSFVSWVMREPTLYGQNIEALVTRINLFNLTECLKPVLEEQ